VPYRGNATSRRTWCVVETLAALHGCATGAMAAQTSANFRALFRALDSTEASRPGLKTSLPSTFNLSELGWASR
jgi:hypothetical protein